LIIVGGTNYLTSGATITDNQSGNTYTHQVEGEPSSSSLWAQIVSSILVGSSGTFTVTATYTPGSYQCISLDEFSFTGTGAIDHTAIVNQTSTTPSTGSVTVTASSTDLIFGIMCCNDADAVSAGSGYTAAYSVINSAGNAVALHAEYQLNVTSTLAATWTKGSTTGCTVAAATWKGTVGASAVPEFWWPIVTPWHYFPPLFEE